MPDAPSPPPPSPEVAALRADNARLRRVVDAQGERLRLAESEVVAEREARRLLELRIAELERQLRRDSGNSSTPESKESIAAKAKRKAERAAARQTSQRVRSKDRKPGGQKGHNGSGLEPAAEPDRTERVDPPAECSGCAAALSGAHDAGEAWAPVWDTPPVALEKVRYLLPRRRCGCGKLTTATWPFARPGTVTYGPNVNAAAVLLGSEGNVPVERTAMLLEALLGAPVSAGFVARAHERLAEALAVAGFDDAMKTALRAEDVLCGDETPVNVLRTDTGEDGRPKPGAPHVVDLRTPDERLVWYAALHSRSCEAIAGIGVLDGYGGYLVRDDYAGWHPFDDQLAGVQQCAAHLIRHLQGVWELHHDWQKWARQVQDVLREANTAVAQAVADERGQLDPDLLAGLRARYDAAVRWGELTNRHRDWDGGKNHPGYVLARRLAAKAEQVWLFTRNFLVPWTN
ncbi:transposase, partial [Frankia sp. CiP3]|uniref:IS66 family transposase n=1 Tax=Frankia sp. CiP3 TaxID=2880971 RepID=UPI0035AB69A9